MFFVQVVLLLYIYARKTTQHALIIHHAPISHRRRWHSILRDPLNRMSQLDYTVYRMPLSRNDIVCAEKGDLI